MNSQKLFSFSLITIFLIVTCVLSASAQTPAAGPSEQELQARVRQLEAQMEQMREELSKLRQALPNANASAVTPESEPAAAADSARNVNAGRGGTETGASKEVVKETAKETATEAARQESKPVSAHQTGIDLGPVRAVPYGTIYFNAFANNGGTNNTDVPLFATPEGQGNLSASARQTRMGLRLEGLRAGRAKLGGTIEADFFGGFPAIGIGEFFGIMRLRHAFVRADWERTSVLVGQDWALFAPLSPVSIASAANPQMAAAGNPWTRLPQIRLERRSPRGRLIWQGAVLAPGTGDFPAGQNSPAAIQPGAGASSRLPVFESRVAVRDDDWLGLKKPGGLGLSVHYGRARVAAATGAVGDNDRIDSFGLALDWSMPIAARVTLAGESFFGRNLAGFQSGVFQGSNPDFAYRRGATSLTPGGPRAVGTRGGWAQIGLTPPAFQDRLTAYASYGLDDPRDEDLVSISPRDSRLRNQAFAFNLLYKLTAQFSGGLEFRRFETQYSRSGKQTANHINLGAAFSF